MEKDMNKLTITQPTLAAKQTPGSRGQEFEVKTNLVKLGLAKNIPIYKYDVRCYIVFTKADGVEVLKELTKKTRDDYCEQERKSGARSIYKKLLAEKADFFGNGFALYYDRAAILFSLKQLSVGNEKQFDLPKGYINGYEGASGFRVIIKQVADSFQTSTNDILKVVNARPGECDKTILEALNLIAGQVPLMSTDFITYGNGTHYLYNPDPKIFSRDDVPALPDGKYTGVGCSKSVKVLTGNGSPAPFMTLDIKKTAFHNDEQPLMQKIEDFAMFRGRFTIDEACRKKKQITPLLKGLTVMTTFGKKPQVFPISGFTDHNANEAKFDFEGKQISVTQYFANKYKIHLKAPQMFLAIGRFGQKSALYPLELLKVAPNQRVIGQQQTPEQISKMGVANPADRFRQTEAMLKTIKINNTNDYMKQAGMTAEQQFTMVKGRILPAPQIKLADATAQVERNCKWNPKGKFVGATQLRKWMVVAMIAPGRDAPQQARLEEYVGHLVRIGNSKGMVIAKPTFFYCSQPSEGEAMKYMKQAKNEGMQLLFFISTDRITLHNYIKKEEALNEMLTQEVKLSKVLSVLEKRQFQTLENVAMKMNSKLGGLSKIVILGSDQSTQAWVCDPNRLFIGFEFSHPAPLSKSELERGETYRTPSVIGYGANCGTRAQYFLGDFKYIEAHQPEALENELQGIFDAVIRQFRTNRKVPPNHLVCYFNGISEGQFGLVAGRYLELVRKACINISEKFKPKMTFIAAMKAHNERLYNKVISGNSPTEQNIPAGLVVDKTIVSATTTEFYLNPHCAFKGTAKTPKYSVLFDDAKMSADAVQGMTHGLCYMHDIVNATISVPAPLMVADRCAKRGANNFAEMHGSENGAIDIARANSLLTYKGKKLANVRYNA